METSYYSVQSWRGARHRQNRKKKRARLLLLCIFLIFSLLCAALVVQLLPRLISRFSPEVHQQSTAQMLPQSQTLQVPVLFPSQSWELTLVNSQHPAPQDYQFETLQLSNGQVVDARIYPSLQKMFDDARAQGIFPQVISGYRSYQDQQALFDAQMNQYLQEGYSQSDAKDMTQLRVAQPGFSEHQMGIAVDINADKTLSTNETVFQWLCDNSYRYGFILRYPADKTHITGVTYEPWHFRYVGEKAAQEIFQSGLTLEEYLG